MPIKPKWHKSKTFSANRTLPFPKAASSSSQAPLLLSFYITSGLLLQSPSNPFFYNSILKSLAAGPNPHLAISLYNHMRRNSVVADNYTFPFVLKACASLSLFHRGRELHSTSLKLGFEYEVFVQNSLIHMYSVCGFVDTARQVFNSMPVWVRDVVSWNSMISGYVQRGHCDGALEVFVNMLGVTKGFVSPNEVTLVSVLTACTQVGACELGRRIHAFVVGSGFLLDVFLGSSLIDMYVKCGQIEDARMVFDGLPQRNVVCWTSMIAGYAQSRKSREAIELFREMLVLGIEADEATVACIFSACAHLGALGQGRWVHTYCERNDIDMNLKVKNALIDMYSKCGDIGEALCIFNGLVQRDVFSWTVMISGLAMNGMSDKALDLFSQMLLLDYVRPNEVTFLGVLSACSHGGLVDEGYYYFNCMKKIYKLTPRIEHYGCMVDLLGRANLLKEAEKFIKTMPIEPDAVIWRSVLFACRNNKNIELAEFAAKQILELEPKKCGAHVLLSNIYAASLRWSDAKKMRKDMNYHGIQKQPGCSFIEVKGDIYEFFVGDRLHPQTNIIYDTIWEMDALLRSEGYIPDNSD